MLSLWSDDAVTVRLWSLTDDALVEEGDDPDELVLVTRWGEQVVDGSDDVAVESLRRMGFGPVNLRNTLPGSARGAAPAPVDVRALEAVLDRLGCAVVHSLALPDGGQPLLSVEPLVAQPEFRPAPLPLDAVVRLSRFAAFRPGPGGLVLDGPDTDFRVVLHQALARAVVTGLVEPCTADDVAETVGAPPVVVAELLSFVVAAGAARVADADGAVAEDTDPDLRGWSHHELLFHEQSRRRARTGAAAPEPPPVTRPLPEGRRYRLHRPDPDTVGGAGPSLTALLESDHVCPELADGVVTAEQLGELLYRSARVRSTGAAHLPSPDGGPAHDASQRPYANIACLYELELYLVLGRCAGLPRGVYHYDPLGHALTLLDVARPEVDQLLDVGRVGAGSIRRPAVMMTVAARTARVSWILPGAAYRVALQHCGALQETVYLVAKSMGLWAHGVPTDAHAVDRTIGLRWPVEIGLGECIIDVLPLTTPADESLRARNDRA